MIRLLAIILVSFPLLIFAQASAPTDLAVDDAIGQLLQSLGGLRGAGALAIVAFIVQAIMLFFRTKLADFAGKWKLLIVTGLTMVGGVLALRLSGVGWGGALLHSTTLSAVAVFGNQLVKQLMEKPA